MTAATSDESQPWISHRACSTPYVTVLQSVVLHSSSVVAGWWFGSLCSNARLFRLAKLPVLCRCRTRQPSIQQYNADCLLAGEMTAATSDSSSDESPSVQSHDP
jgi:hypothetical protein